MLFIACLDVILRCFVNKHGNNYQGMQIFTTVKEENKAKMTCLVMFSELRDGSFKHRVFINCLSAV